MARVTDTEITSYNTRYHLRVLNVEYLKNEFGLDFVEKEGSLTKANNKMVKISLRIYNYIYNHKQRNKSFWEWYFAFEPLVLETLEKALIEQATFDYEYNAMDLHNQLGVNLLNGTTISLETLRGERGIALEAINILRNYKDGTLLYAGKEMYMPLNVTYDYNELGY